MTGNALALSDKNLATAEVAMTAKDIELKESRTRISVLEQDVVGLQASLTDLKAELQENEKLRLTYLQSNPALNIHPTPCKGDQPTSKKTPYVATPPTPDETA